MNICIEIVIFLFYHLFHQERRAARNKKPLPQFVIYLVARHETSPSTQQPPPLTRNSGGLNSSRQVSSELP